MGKENIVKVMCFFNFSLVVFKSKVKIFNKKSYSMNYRIETIRYKIIEKINFSLFEGNYNMAMKNCLLSSTSLMFLLQYVRVTIYFIIIII